MNILYIHQYFRTPSEPGGTRSYWIARELIKHGHQVTLITANPKAEIDREEKFIDGIRVIYLKEAYSQDMSISQRLRSFLGFVGKSIKEARRHRGVNLVIATSTPLTVGISALYMKWFHGIPFVFEVRDLWPEVPIQMGAFKNPLIIKLLKGFERKIYRNAKHVVALSPGMQEGVLKYIPKEKTSMIPNMSKIDKFWPREKNIKLMEGLGLDRNSFKVIHFGALGLANGVETIIESAVLLKEDPSVVFIFLGGGAMEKSLIRKCEEAGLENVKFLGQFPMNETSEIVNFCDVSIVSFKDLPILYTNSPNKLFDSLSAGKPIIVNSAGWTKELVENNKCGLYVSPEKPEELKKAIVYLKNNPEICIRMGEASRKLAKSKYDKSILCNEFANIVDRLNGCYKLSSNGELIS